MLQALDFLAEFHWLCGEFDGLGLVFSVDERLAEHYTHIDAALREVRGLGLDDGPVGLGRVFLQAGIL